MSTAQTDIIINGKDNTASAFQSIQARAAAASNRIAKVMGAAVAAAGAYLSVRAFTDGINELGKLSDMAMKAGTSVESLTQTSLAFRVAGLDMPVESLTKAFQHLVKETGEGGIDNFFKTAEAISKIEDPAKRGAELVRNFGRAGLELQPLISGGSEAISKMQKLTSLMPGVSQAAANAGDEASDALTIFGEGAHSLFLRVVGDITRKFSQDMPGGVRAGALSAVNWVETWYEKSKAYIKYFGLHLKNEFALVSDIFVPGMQLVGASIRKVFETAIESLKYVGSSIKSVIKLAINLVKEGPSAAWRQFTDEMAAANERFTSNVFDSSEFDEPIARLMGAGDKYAAAEREAAKELNSRIEAADKKREAYLKELAQFNVDDLANAMGGKHGKGVDDEADTTASKQPPRITNQLIGAGTNAQQKLALLGPEYQNESKRQTAELKKQNETLKQIAENTAKVAEDSGETAYLASDLGA